MKKAVRARYFRDDPDGPTRTYNRLTSYLRCQIDPERDGVWTASGHSAYDDLVYYLVSVLDLPGIHDTLLDVRFVWSRALEGKASVEALLLDYQHARHRLSSAKYTEVKGYLQTHETTREAELLALGEFREYVLRGWVRGPAAMCCLSAERALTTVCRQWPGTWRQTVASCPSSRT